jgi:hypothetical protein
LIAGVTLGAVVNMAVVSTVVSPIILARVFAKGR